jgi:hypothetical protein
MQQPLLHWLLDVQSAWHALSLLTQTAPLAIPDPAWQHSPVVVQVPPGATQEQCDPSAQTLPPPSSAAQQPLSQSLADEQFE